jgi:hypothetical protein
MNNLLVVIPYHGGDLEIAKKLIEWIVELGDCKPHSLLLAADSGISQDVMRELMDLARPAFVSVRTMIVAVPRPTSEQKVWAPNVVFLAVARQVNENYKFPFLFLEPDAIPISKGWLNEIATAYAESPKRFMGSVIKQVGQIGLPAEYLNGVAVYPNDAIDVFENIQAVKTSEQAFDIGSAVQVLPKAAHTTLIHHFWGEKDLPPVFVESLAPGAPKNHVTMGFIKPGAVVFHRSKDGGLINLLRVNSTRASEPLGNPVMTAFLSEGQRPNPILHVRKEEKQESSPELSPDEKKQPTPPPMSARIPTPKKQPA